MSGIEEAALAAWIANAAADSALVYGGLAAGEGTAAAALGTGALSGAVGTAAGTAMGGGALSQADILMAQAMDQGGTAVAQQGLMSTAPEVSSQLPMSEVGSQLPMSQAPNVTSSLLQPGSAESSLFGNIAEGQPAPSQLTDYERFIRFGKQGLTKLGSGLAKTGMTGTVAKSLLDPGTPPQQQQVMARQPGGGAPQQQPSSVSLLGQQQPYQARPYAPTLAGVGGDDAEMQRRRKLMLQQMGYA
jgi:hypothetical protein